MHTENFLWNFTQASSLLMNQFSSRPYTHSLPQVKSISLSLFISHIPCLLNDYFGKFAHSNNEKN